MKKLAFLFSALLVFCSSESMPPYQEYIKQYAPVAVSEMKRSGVPASITLAQGLLESGAGKSTLAREGNNHFGIKCHNDWKGRTMKVDDDAIGECFRVYDAAEESFKDHSDFLRFRDRYKFLFDLKPTDYKGWAMGLKKAGYATDPQYAQKLIARIEQYELFRYDTDIPVEEIPMTPVAIEEASTEIAKTQRVREVISFSLRREVYTNNGVSFVYSIKGETYGSIAKSYGLFQKEILAYNDQSASATLPEGTRVYIEPKKKYGAKGMDKYVVDHNGESLVDICQRFAVKKSSILKLNGLADNYIPKEGDMLKLRK